MRATLCVAVDDPLAVARVVGVAALGTLVKRIRRFTLERHTGEYETWPLRSRVYADGAPTRLRVPGYSLLHQFEVEDGYLLVTDHDCPFEEATAFTLVSRELRILSRRVVGRAYHAFVLHSLEWIDERSFVASFGDDYRLRFTLRRRGIPLLWPRLGVRRLPDPSTQV